MFTKAEVMLTGSFAETVRRRQVRREQPLFRRMNSPAGSTDGIGGCLLPSDIPFVIFKNALESAGSALQKAEPEPEIFTY